MTFRHWNLLSAARYLVLALICIAPWPYGCIPRWTHPWFSSLLLATAILWGVGLVFQRRKPSVPVIPVICACLLLIHGWLLIANAQYSYDWLQFAFVPVHPWWSGNWAPGAVDTVDALPAMWRITALLTIFFVIADMASDAMWRQRLLRSMLLAGISITLYGLIQRLLHQPLLLWNESDLQHNLFAGFYYHGNAGAFVNVLIPPSIAYATLAFCRRDAHTTRAFWIASLILLLAAEVAIASKAAMLVTAALVLISGFVCIRYTIEKKILRSRKASWQLAIGAGVALLGIILFGFDRAAQRWAQLPQLLRSDNPRFSAWKACLRMLPDAGPWGIGPANFRIAFPHYTEGLPATAGVWEHAHQDFLETCIDWGWWGVCVWAAMVGGALWHSARSSSLQPQSFHSERLLDVSLKLSLIGVLLHGLVDFPLQIPVIQLYAAILVGILWRRSATPSLSESPSRFWHMLIKNRPTQTSRPVLRALRT